MKKTIKTFAFLATALAVGATAVPFDVNAAETTVTSKYTAEQQAAIRTIFNPTDYAEMYPDVAAAFGNDENKLFEHYLVFGIGEDRAPSKSFNVNAYASSYADLQVAFGDNVDSYLIHYATLGQKENRTLTTIEAANQHGYSVYSIATFKTGVKGVSGASLLSGGAISLTDRNSGKTTDSNSATKKEIHFKWINGETAEELPAYEGMTFGEWLTQEGESDVIQKDGTLLFSNDLYLFNLRTGKLVLSTDVIEDGGEYTLEKDDFANLIKFTIGNVTYYVDKTTMWEAFFKDNEDYKNKSITVENDKPICKTEDSKRYYLYNGNEAVKYSTNTSNTSNKPQKDAAYSWKQVVTFTIDSKKQEDVVCDDTTLYDYIKDNSLVPTGYELAGVNEKGDITCTKKTSDNNNDSNEVKSYILQTSGEDNKPAKGNTKLSEIKDDTTFCWKETN